MDTLENTIVRESYGFPFPIALRQMRLNRQHWNLGITRK